MRDYKEQTRATREQRDTAKESQKQHASDLNDMKEVASLAADDLETRKKYRHKRAASVSTTQAQKRS